LTDVFISVILCLILTIRIYGEFYSFDYDAFTKNYEILGLPTSEDVTMKQVKQAYTPLALKLKAS